MEFFLQQGLKTFAKVTLSLKRACKKAEGQSAWLMDAAESATRIYTSLLFSPPYSLLFSYLLPTLFLPTTSLTVPLCQVLHRRRHPERLAHPADRPLLPHGPSLPGKQVSAQLVLSTILNT